MINSKETLEKINLGGQSPTTQIKRKSSLQLTSPTKRQIPHEDLQDKIKRVDPLQMHLKDVESLDILVQIMKKHPLNRKDYQLIFMQRLLLDDVKFFQEINSQIPPEQMQNLMRHLKYQYHCENSTLFRIGDVGDKFYILLSGSIVVLKQSENYQEEIKKPDARIQQVHHLQVEQTEKHHQIQNEDYESGDEVIIEEDINQVILKGNPGHEIVFEISQGNSFGEIALRTMEGKRTGTLITREDCHLAVLAADSYFKIIKKYHDKLYKQKIEFLKKISIFSASSTTLVLEILNSARLVNYQRGEVVYQPGGDLQYMYFIQEGEIQIQMESGNFQEHNLQKQMENQFMGYNIALQQIVNKSKQQMTSIIKLGQYEVFGEYDIFKWDQRTTFTICSTDCEIFQIKSSILLKSIWDQTVKQQIGLLFKERNQVFEKIIELKQKQNFQFDYLPSLQKNIQNFSEQDIINKNNLRKLIQEKFQSMTGVPRIGETAVSSRDSNSNFYNKKIKLNKEEFNRKSNQKQPQPQPNIEPSADQNELYQKLKSARTSLTQFSSLNNITQIKKSSSMPQLDEVISSINSNFSRRNFLSNFTQETSFIQNELSRYKEDTKNFFKSRKSSIYRPKIYEREYQPFLDSLNTSRVLIEKSNQSFYKVDHQSSLRSNSVLLDRADIERNIPKRLNYVFNILPDSEKGQQKEQVLQTTQADEILENLNLSVQRTADYQMKLPNFNDYPEDRISPRPSFNQNSAFSPSNWLESQLKSLHIRNSTQSSTKQPIKLPDKLANRDLGNFPSFIPNQHIKSQKCLIIQKSGGSETQRVLQIIQSEPQTN